MPKLTGEQKTQEYQEGLHEPGRKLSFRQDKDSPKAAYIFNNSTHWHKLKAQTSLDW